MTYLLLFFLPLFAQAKDPVTVDGLVAKVGREAVLESDLLRFKDVAAVLSCAGVIKREVPEPRKEMLDLYIEEELMYLEARSKKVSTAGLIPQAVHSIHQKDECKKRWQKLGTDYSKYFRTENRASEGESLLVRELEKRVLVEKFRTTEVVTDAELWRREARARYPVKVYWE